MGILNTVGEIAGAVAAVEAAEKVDPDAGLLTKAAAAVAGIKGAEALQNLVEKNKVHGAAHGENTGAPAPPSPPNTDPPRPGRRRDHGRAGHRRGAGVTRAGATASRRARHPMKRRASPSAFF